MRSFQAILMTLLVATCQSFTQISVGRPSITKRGIRPLNMVSSSSARCNLRTVLFSSADEPEKEPSTAETTPESATPPAPAPATSVVPKPVKMDMEEASADVPLDVPSPILLASSIILAIISVGSLFDLLGGSPSFGFAPTAATALVGLPVCFFLFYAAIVKGQKETEEDDKRSNSGGF